MHVEPKHDPLRWHTELSYGSIPIYHPLLNKPSVLDVCALWLWWGCPEVRLTPCKQDELSAQAFKGSYSASAEEWQLPTVLPW